MNGSYENYRDKALSSLSNCTNISTYYACPSLAIITKTVLFMGFQEVPSSGQTPTNLLSISAP